MRKMVLLGILLLFFLSINMVNAENPVNHSDTGIQDIYVSTTGNDSSNTGANVDSPYATIAKGVSNANDSRNATIHLSEGIFTGTGNIVVDINKAHRSQGGSLTIVGAGYNKTFIDANSVNYIFNVQADSIVKLLNLTLVNGKNTNGGAIVNAGNLSITDCIFEKNYATTSGGAIRSTSGSLTISNSKFNSNSAASYGGVIYTANTWTNISDSSFTNNYAKYGGAVSLNNASIMNSYFAYNYATTNYGGSIAISGSLINNIIINSTVNGTSGRGGAVYLSGSSYLKNNTMINCSAGAGRYIYLNSGNINANITFNDATITLPTSTVNATVTDDMGHPIYGGTLNFYAGNESLGSASVKEGMATVTYTKLLKSNGLCNLTGGSASFTDLSNIKNGTLTVNIDRTPRSAYVSPTGSDDTGDGSEGNPYKTISKAIQAAFSNSYYPTIYILEGNYSGAGNTNMSLTNIGVLSLIGETYNKTVIDGENQSWIFNFGQYTQVILKNLTFQNVISAGAVSANSDFNIDSCIFNNGNAVSGSSSDTIKILKNSVFNNACSSISGSEGSYAVISDCSFSNCPSSALYGSNLNVTNCKFINNTAYRDGGAIYFQGNLISTNNQYINNFANTSESNFGRGGAIYCSGSSYVQSVNDTFIGNNASMYGGAIYVGFGSNSGATLIVINGTFTSNSAGIYGGAIYANADPNYGLRNLTLINSTMNSNTAVTNGNDVYLAGSSLITGSNLTFVGNSTVNISKLAGDLTATVTDDNGNSVSGGSVSFYLDGEYIGQANVINGVATLNYVGFKNGTYNLTGTSSNAADPVYTKNGVVKVAISTEKDSVEYYVSKSGNDSTGNGTVSNPFLTIQKALNTGFELSRNIVIHLLEGTYSGIGNTNITLPGTMNITIIGDGVNKTIIDGESTTNWIFNITLGNGLITLDGLSLLNSKSNTASPVIIDNACVKILNSYFGNNTGFNGGAINNQGNLIINNTTFYANKAISNSAGNYGGGAIFNTGTLIINSISLLNNAATTGTGIFNAGNLSISDSLIGNNNKSTWSNMGSAIYGGNVTVVKCIFTNNTGSGNNYDISGTSFLEIYNSTFYNLTMGIGSLAKIYNSLFNNMTSTLYLKGEIYNSTFRNISTISFTGEIYNSTFFNSSVSCSDTEIYNSSFTKMNNAITVTGGDLIIVGSLFDDNACAISGSGGNVNISNCVILDPVQVTASNLTLDYNWWGSNIKPVITGGNINYWLVIALTSDNKPGLNRNITLAFKSTDGEKIYAFNGYLPARDYLFSVPDGSISPVSGNLMANAVNATFNAGTYGNHSINVTVDNQTLNCTFELYQANSTTTVDLSNSTSKQGNKVVITANVKDEKSGNPVDGGEVEFFIGNTSIGKAEVHNGKATKEWMIDKDKGLYEINVRYCGSDDYFTSDNHAFLTVTSVNTTTSVSLSNSSVKYGDRVNVTAVVRETASGNVVNGGGVKFYNGSTLIGIADLVNGVATFKNWIVDMAVGQYNITAQYMGLGDYLVSQAQTVFSEISYNGTTWNIYNYLNNTQIQYILNNCVNNSNIIFNSGQYNNLTLTISKPVNIKNNGAVIVMGNGSGTAFTINANATIQGLTIKNYTTAILNKVNNVSVVNNTFAGDVYGFVNYGSGSGVKIGTNNVFQSNKGSAIYNYGNNLTFKGFKLVNNKVGIINKGSNVDMLYNTISGGEYGIINYQKSADINYNTISSASKDGIYNAGSSSKIGHNTLKTNYYGINNKGSTSTISYNTISGGSKGIVNSASSTTINGNTVKSVTSAGVSSSGSSVKIYKNTLTGLNKGYGIYLAGSTKSNVVQSNTVSKFYYGLWNAGYKNTLQSNTLKYNKVGLDLYKTAKYSTVIYNKVYKNTSYGVYNRGYKTTLYKNQITYNTKYGLGTVKSVKNTKNTIRGNKVNTRLIK